MKVIVATTTSPFVYGGASLLVDWLEEALTNRGHEVETYRIPFESTSGPLPAQIVGLRLWDFTGHGDRLITVRTPSYLIRHHSKVVWFLHHHRQSYDLWDYYRDVPDDQSGREFRRMMFASDEVGLSECRAVFTNSKRVSDRLAQFNDISSEVLYPPLGEAAATPDGPYGDYLVYVSRVTAHKRQLLALRAMQHVTSPVKLVIAGRADDARLADEISSEIDRLGLIDRVSFLNTVVSDDTKAGLIAGSLGVVYVPFDEDSYGFVGLEAAGAAKPLVTTTDAGGVLELVQDGVNGFACNPTPESLAAAYDRLYADRARAARLGQALQRRVVDLDISWDHVVDRLLS